MSVSRLSREIRLRILVVAVLGACAVGLLAALVFTRPGFHDAAGEGRVSREVIADIDAAIDTVLAHHSIHKEWVRTWRSLVRGKQSARTQRRVLVPPEFMSLAFNHELNLLLSPLGANAVASERMKESTVDVHIIKDGLILETIMFVVRHDLKSPE